MNRFLLNVKMKSNFERICELMAQTELHHCMVYSDNKKLQKMFKKNGFHVMIGTLDGKPFFQVSVPENSNILEQYKPSSASLLKQLNQVPERLNVRISLQNGSVK